MRHRLKIGLIFCLMASLVACSRSPIPNYFILNPLSIFKTSTLKKPLKIGLDPIDIAPYLQKPQLATRVSAHQINFDEQNLWAERLEKNIARVIETNLNNLSNKRLVETAPWPTGFMPDYRVQVSLIDFNANLQGQSLLKARYQIVDEGGTNIVFKRQISYRRKLKRLNPQEVVASMNANLNALSRDIARHLPRKKPPKNSK